MVMKIFVVQILSQTVQPIQTYQLEYVYVYIYITKYVCVYCVSYVLFNNNFFFFLLALSLCFSYECIHRPAGAISFSITLSRTHARTHQSSRLMKKKVTIVIASLFLSLSSQLIKTNRLIVRIMHMLPISLSLELYLYINTLLPVNRNNSFFAIDRSNK